jgi:hypothetical protein
MPPGSSRIHPMGGAWLRKAGARRPTHWPPACPARFRLVSRPLATKYGLLGTGTSHQPVRSWFTGPLPQLPTVRHHFRAPIGTRRQLVNRSDLLRRGNSNPAVAVPECSDTQYGRIWRITGGRWTRKAPEEWSRRRPPELVTGGGRRSCVLCCVGQRGARPVACPLLILSIEGTPGNTRVAHEWDLIRLYCCSNTFFTSGCSHNTRRQTTLFVSSTPSA